jgi:hypothetical protein
VRCQHQALALPVPALQPVVVGPAEQPAQHPGAPLAFKHRHRPFDLVVAEAGEGLVAPDPSGQVEQDQGRRADRMRGGEEHGRSRPQAQHDGPLLPERAEDRDHVVGDGLDDARLAAGERRRRAVTAGVEPGVAGE